MRSGCGMGRGRATRVRGSGVRGGIQSGTQQLHSHVCRELGVRSSDVVAWAETRRRWRSTTSDEAKEALALQALVKRQRRGDVCDVSRECPTADAPAPVALVPFREVARPEPVCVSTAFKSERDIDAGVDLAELALARARLAPLHQRSAKRVEHPVSAKHLLQGFKALVPTGEAHHELAPPSGLRQGARISQAAEAFDPLVASGCDADSSSPKKVLCPHQCGATCVRDELHVFA